MMKKIAFYGKGGIGKSTTAANVSAAFSKMGKKVCQIGCDPKNDSTRLLLGQICRQTVLDLVRDAEDDIQAEQIVHTGFNGIKCVEAGGPEPGVGCAGRGIIVALEKLKELEVLNDEDLVLYDVLGDVVCEMFIDRVSASKNYQKEKYTDKSALEYFEKSVDHYMIHPDTKAMLEYLLVMLSVKGEEYTYSYIKKEVLKGHIPYEKDKINQLEQGLHV